MNNKDFFKHLEERQLRMVFEQQLPRPQIVVRRAAAPTRAPASLLPAILIVGFAFWLVYAILRTVPA